LFSWGESEPQDPAKFRARELGLVVLTRDLRAALARLNPHLPPPAITEAAGKLPLHDFSR